LREQLAKFQRKHQEVLSRTAAAVPAAPSAAAPAPMKKESGFFSRIFRGGN
jgi:hypothetical protein